jgi:hypothetical protein
MEQPARGVNLGRASADIVYEAARLEAGWKANMNDTGWLLVAALLVVPVVACLDAYAWLSVTTTAGPAWLLALLVGLLALAVTLTLTVLVWLTKLCIRAVR